MSEHLDRRRFVQAVGAGIGALGTVAASGADAGQARATRPRPSGADDFPKPEGLRTGAQLDSRFPVTFATPVSEGMRLMVKGINVHLYCPVGAAFSLSFTRYTPDGYKLLVSDGVYSVTNNDGRWAIQLASTNRSNSKA